ncbi:MAG: histidine kinase N-terminal 7TM domain-containing protein [Candidatus Margulisiibacteriota bacterium]
MIDFSWLFAASELLAGLFCLSVGLVVRYRLQDRLTAAFLSITLGLALAGGFQALLRIAPDLILADLCWDLATVGWVVMMTSYLHFALIFARREPKYPILIYLVGLPVLVLAAATGLTTTGFVRTPFGLLFKPGFLYPLYLTTLQLYLLVGLGFITGVLLRAPEFYRRKQARYIIIATLLPQVFGLLFDQLAVVSQLTLFPLAVFFAALTSGSIGYIIIKFFPLRTVSPGEAAEAAALALSDPLFLTDERQTINYVNQAACRLVGCRADELLGKELGTVYRHDNGQAEAIRQKSGVFEPVEMRSFPITGGRGFIYLARALGPIARSRAATQRATAELNGLVKREERTITFLFELSRQKDEAALELAWDKIKREGLELQATLQPVYQLMRDYARILAETERTRDALLSQTRQLTMLNELLVGRDRTFSELKEEYRRLQG